MAKQSQNPGDQGQDQGQDRKLSALDRAILAAIGDGGTVGRQDDPARQQYPDVWEWLTKTDGGRDYIMQPAVITIQLGPEGVLAKLTHRDLKRNCGIACNHLGDVLEALQRALTSPNPPITAWGKDPEARLKKRRPR